MNRRHDPCSHLTTKAAVQSLNLFSISRSFLEKLLFTTREKHKLFFMLAKEFITVHCKAIIRCQNIRKIFLAFFIVIRERIKKGCLWKFHSTQFSLPFFISTTAEQKLFCTQLRSFLCNFAAFYFVCLATQRLEKGGKKFLKPFQQARKK